MADIAGGYTSPYTSPTFSYNITYSQTGRSGSAVSYHFNIASSLGSGSSFGYSLGWSLWINGQNWTGSIKGNEMWYGANTWNTGIDVTVSAGAGGGTLSAELIITRPGGEGNSGKMDTGARTVNISSWNTKPYWSSAWCTASPTGTIPENTNSLTVSWGGAYDTEGNTIYYTVKRYWNGSYDATIASGTTSTSCTDNISWSGQGSQFYYSVEMHDGSLWADSAIWSNTVTKNIFTTATLSTSASIGFSTTSVALSYSGASNSNGNGTFTYSLSCSQVTVYNPTSTPTSVTVYKSGGLPSGTYIKFDDIKSVTSSNSYTGTFTFTLTTTNAYGSSGTYSCTMSIDLRTNPTAFTVTGIGGYYTINTPTATNYYVPNKQNPTVTWGASTDQLGGSITYDIQVKLGTGAFSTILTGLTTTSATVAVGSVLSRTNCIIRIISKTSFGYTTTADSSTIVLDYYNPPTITFNTTLRTINDMTASGTIALNTSIPNVTVTTLTYVGKTSGSLTLATTFSKQETGLIDTETYSFSVTVQDSAGAIIGTSATSKSITIPRYVPMLSIREQGVGVNALADANNKLIVGGNTTINGNLTITGTFSGGSPGSTFNKNTVTIGTATNTCAIGIVGFDKNTSLLFVYQNGMYLHNGSDYTIDSSSANITLASGNWASGTVIEMVAILVGSLASVNASYLDGYDSSMLSTPNTVVVRDSTSSINVNNITSSGYIVCNGSISAENGDMSLKSQLVGDYVAKTTANKMIWTIGYNWNTWASQYGLAYEYVTPPGGSLDHCFSIRGAGASRIQLGMNSGSAWFNGNVAVQGKIFTDRLQCYTSNNTYLGSGNCRVDTTGTSMRLFTSAVGASDYGIRLDSDGSFTQIVNGSSPMSISAGGKVTASGGFGGVARVNAFSWNGTVPVGSYVDITHNLGYCPLYHFDGTIGNVIITTYHVSVNVLRVSTYSSGGNTFAGNIRMY